MPYTTPNFTTIRDRILRDIRNLDESAHTDVDSDNFIRASATASAAEGLYDYQNWIARQIFPDTADNDTIDYHSNLRGIVRKKATAATGTLTFTGNEGAAIPTGTLCKDAAGLVYATTAPADIPASGTVTAPCTALKAGASPDVQDVSVTLQAAPFGVHSKAFMTLAGGTDAESHASLLARLLYYMQNPPGGGNKADYKRWALEVEGVTGASVYPLRQGPGTVDIVITGEDGIPSQDVVEACQHYIDSMRPCTAKAATVYAPVPHMVDMTIRLRVSAGGATLMNLQTAVTDVLTAQFALLAPGETVVLAKLLAAVAGLAGVADAAIITPSANVPLEGLKWARLGTVNLEGM